MAAAIKLNRSSTSLYSAAGRGSEGNTPGLCQHGQTSRIVPEIDRRWHFVDLTCNAASQTSGDGANSPIPLQAEGTAKIATGKFLLDQGRKRLI